MTTSAYSSGGAASMPNPCPICGSPLPRPGLRRCTCGALLHVMRDGTVERQEGELTEEAKFALSGLLAARWMVVAHKEVV